MYTEPDQEPVSINFNERIAKAQKAASARKWTDFKQIFEEDPRDLLEDFDLFGNTAINVATRSDDPKLLRELLLLLHGEERWFALTRPNEMGETLLHEVALREVVEMADVVFKFEMETAQPLTVAEEGKKVRLVEIMNRKGETPLFRAAKLGNLNMVKHMVKRIKEQKGDMEVHLRSEKQTILHATIMEESFDVAYWIMMTIKDDRKTTSSLVSEENKKQFTCFHILAKKPHAFRSHFSMGSFSKFIYNLLPEEEYEIEGSDSNDARPPTSDVSRINYAFWKYLAKVFPNIDSLWKKKKQHKLVERLTEMFVRDDSSWKRSYKHVEKKTRVILDYAPQNIAKCKKQMDRREEKKLEQKFLQDKEEKQKQRRHQSRTPLLVAACNGIIEIVELYLKEHPEAVHQVSNDQQNVLHMAVKYRQLGIYRLLKKNPSFNMLASTISKKNRTVLHQVASMDYYRAAHVAGVAFQLQDELKWYKRVEKIVPSRFKMHYDQDELTPGDLLEIEHYDMLKDAQSWIKETAQSCSTVGVLVATVVFAAAYTIPGGSSASGTPVYIRSPVFIFFTVMDVVALALSLASVVMFLSILTSPFELWDFYKSLPRKLNLGFAFLFLSLTATMLAFSATVLLTIRLQWKDWTSTLVYTAAFFPVSIFAMVEFPLYTKIPGLLMWAYKKVIRFR